MIAFIYIYNNNNIIILYIEIKFTTNKYYLLNIKIKKKENNKKIQTYNSPILCHIIP